MWFFGCVCYHLAFSILLHVYRSIHYWMVWQKLCYMICFCLCFLQYLNLIITSELPATDLEFQEDKDELSTINVSCFVDVQEWSLCDYVSSVPYTESKVFSQKRNVNTKFPGISVGCCAVRRAGFFVWNVIVIMARISITFLVYLSFYVSSFWG